MYVTVRLEESLVVLRYAARIRILASRCAYFYASEPQTVCSRPKNSKFLVFPIFSGT